MYNNFVFGRLWLQQRKKKMGVKPLGILMFFGVVLMQNSLAQKAFVVEEFFEYEISSVETGQGAVDLGFNPSPGYWDETNQVPHALLTFPVGGNKFNYQVAEETWVELLPEEARLLGSIETIDKLNAEKSITQQSGKTFGVLDLPAVRRNPKTDQLEKLVQVNLEVTAFSNLKGQSRSFTQTSVLSSGSGEWYRIGVAEDGVYKVSYAMLESMGIDMSGMNPNRINIYGNGQGMLNENNSAPRIDDLSLRDIMIVGDDDGSFDQTDYIVFYAKGPHDFTYQGGKIRHTTNNFTDTAYYFINVSGSANPSRIGNAQLSGASPTHVTSTFNDFYYIEEDELNLAKSGQEWMGDLFDVQLNKSYSFDIANLSLTDSVDIGALIGISTPTTINDAKFTVAYQGKSMEVEPVSGSGQGTTSPKARLSYNSFRVKQGSGSIDVSLTFDKDGMSSARGYLDYLEINCVRQLQMEGNQMEFYHLSSIGSGNVTEFILSNAADVDYIWEVTDNINPGQVNFSQGGSVSFKVSMDSLRTFVAFKDNQYLEPTYFGQVEHQNLHGLEYADIIMITTNDLMPAAQRLAAHHKTEGLSSHILTQQQIFNEFSSGMRDPVAIRHFLKMFYDRAGGDPLLYPRFCVIIGDCSYDYRNRLNSNSDYVITYESKESLTTGTYSTDDFYVILDDSEIMRGTDLMDMAVGRLPVATLEEAEGMVDKIIAYSGQASTTSAEHCGAVGEGVYGDWRNFVMMISDDSDSNAYFTDVENMYGILSSTHDELNIVKVHTDAYQETVTPGGERNPDATAEIDTRVNRGALLVNYIGHGGELGWAHEEVLNVPTINNWTNAPKLPVFMTATCEFSRYDDHDRVSAGEYVVLNSNGGGVGLFTTTRLVYTTSNRQLARVFYDTVADKVDGAPQYIGEIYRGSKNKFAINHGSSEARKFTYLGDPAVRFALPNHNVILDSVNGIAITSFLDTLKALSGVTISGHIENSQGALLNTFDGFVYPTIYDKISSLTTLGNSSGSTPAGFELWKNIVYRGKASVNDGRFTFSFIIPKDIAYNFGPGRFSFYAQNGADDANGVNEEPLIGGINTSAPADGQGPQIDLFMNNLNFVNGGITDASPVFIAKVFDDNGINMVGNGIGHNIEIRIDNESEPVILNDYYESDVDTYKSGEVRFQLSDLSAGEHTITFKVWDVYNNSSEEVIEFVVTEDENVAIDHLLNYPNPFTTNTEFSFEHNQVCDYLDVQIQIFTISGKLVKNIQERVNSDGFRVDGIFWDGRDEFGDKIGIGTYVYKLSVVNEAGKKEEKFEKLFILR